MENDLVDGAGPALPKGVLRPKGRGWAGEDLELNREYEDTKLSDHAAVNTSQFFNKEVGAGYQAKHVIRQNVGRVDDKIKILDMRGGNSENKKKRKSSFIKNGKERRGKKAKQFEDINEEEVLLSEMMQCEALCQFKREILKILQSTAK